MKTQFVLTATAACFCVASCTTDPALAEKKKSTSIGRFGVSQYVPPTAEAPAPAPTPAPVPPAVEATPAAPAPVATVAAPEVPAAPEEKKKSVSIGRFGVSQYVPPAGEAPAVQEAPKKKSGGLFSWFRKKDPTADAPAAVAVEEKPAKRKVPEPAGREAVAEFREPTNKKPLADDIRLPNMLGMPEEKDLKATNPSVPKSGEGGSVISRPPVEKKKE